MLEDPGMKDASALWAFAECGAGNILEGSVAQWGEKSITPGLPPGLSPSTSKGPVGGR